MGGGPGRPFDAIVVVGRDSAQSPGKTASPKERRPSREDRTMLSRRTFINGALGAASAEVIVTVTEVHALTQPPLAVLRVRAK